MNFRCSLFNRMRMMGCLFACFATLITASAQHLQTPLERSGYAKATSHDALQTFLQTLTTSSSKFSLESIGTSVQGRDIPVIHVLSLGHQPKIKVLVFAQQHGNEPSGKEAALSLLRDIKQNVSTAVFKNLDLYIVPTLNPDGNESRKRANANGADLNRDHLLLSQPETQALHRLFARLDPEVTLDVHEYAAYRKEFRAAGYVRSADEQFGAPTNLSISPVIRNYALNTLFPFLENTLTRQGLRFSNYYKMDGPADTVRASTTAIDDGRQSLAILHSFSFILEGKNGREMNDELERRTTGQQRAIEAFLSFVDAHADQIRTMVQHEQQSLFSSTDSVVIRMDYVCGGATIELPMKMLASGNDTLVRMPYSPSVIPFASVRPPTAYRIPKERTDIIAFLERNGISFNRVDQPSVRKGEIYTVDRIQRVWMENKKNDHVSTRIRTASVTMEPGDVIVPLGQRASRKIVIALEPSSMWGIVQYDEFPALCEVGKDYPITRILD